MKMSCLFPSARLTATGFLPRVRFAVFVMTRMVFRQVLGKDKLDSCLRQRIAHKIALKDFRLHTSPVFPLDAITRESLSHDLDFALAHLTLFM